MHLFLEFHLIQESIEKVLVSYTGTSGGLGGRVGSGSPWQEVVSQRNVVVGWVFG